MRHAIAASETTATNPSVAGSPGRTGGSSSTEAAPSANRHAASHTGPMRSSASRVPSSSPKSRIRSRATGSRRAAIQVWGPPIGLKSCSRMSQEYALVARGQVSLPQAYLFGGTSHVSPEWGAVPPARSYGCRNERQPLSGRGRSRPRHHPDRRLPSSTSSSRRARCRSPTRSATRPAPPTTTSSTASPRSAWGSAASSSPGSAVGPPVDRRADRPRGADLVRPGDRARPAPGLLGAVPDLEPGPQRDPAPVARLEHPPERRLLHHLPDRHAPGHCHRAVRVLPGRTGSGSSSACGGR